MVKSHGAEHYGKARENSRLVRFKKMNESEPLIKCRKEQMASKPRGCRTLGINVGETCLPPTWCPAWKRHDLESGSCAEHGNLSLRFAIRQARKHVCSESKREKPQAAETARVKVPIRSTGTEQPVVALKSAKADGAKGLRYPALSQCQLN